VLSIIHTAVNQCRIISNQQLSVRGFVPRAAPAQGPGSHLGWGGWAPNIFDHCSFHFHHLGSLGLIPPNIHSGPTPLTKGLQCSLDSLTCSEYIRLDQLVKTSSIRHQHNIMHDSNTIQSQYENTHITPIFTKIAQHFLTTVAVNKY